MNVPLPDFIKRSLAFFDKAEANLTASEQLASAQSRVAALEAELETARAAATGFEVTIRTLTGDLEAKSDEAKKLQEQLDAALGKANAVIGSQGLPIDQLPVTSPNASVTGATTSPLNDLRRQLAEADTPAEKFRISQAIRALLSPKQTD